MYVRDVQLHKTGHAHASHVKQAPSPHTDSATGRTKSSNVFVFASTLRRLRRLRLTVGLRKGI